MTTAALSPWQHAVRRIPLRWIAIFSGTVALLVTLVAIPFRWYGFFDDNGIDWTPLRPLSAQEAAHLVQGHQAVIVSMTPSSATIAVPRTRFIWKDDRASGQIIFIDSYYSSYTLNRSELEVYLGHTLSPQDIQPYRSINSDHPICSFTQEHLVWYALFEVCLLWGSMLGIWLLLRTTTSIWQLAYPFVPLSLAFGLIVGLVYSPALFDYDYFGQRILVEWLVLRVTEPVLTISLVLSLVGLAHDVVIRVVAYSRKIAARLTSAKREQDGA